MDNLKEFKDAKSGLEYYFKDALIKFCMKWGCSIRDVTIENNVCPTSVSDTMSVSIKVEI